MAINSIFSSATSGLKAASLRAESAAGNIANLDTPGYEGTTVSQLTVTSGNGLNGGNAIDAQLRGSGAAPDLGTEIIRLIEADLTYRANAEVLRTASDISKETLNIHA